MITYLVYELKKFKKLMPCKCLPCMPKVVFDSWMLDICLVWKVFVNIPFHGGANIPAFTFQEFQDASI
jgi:hypothetical protein